METGIWNSGILLGVGFEDQLFPKQVSFKSHLLRMDRLEEQDFLQQFSKVIYDPNFS